MAAVDRLIGRDMTVMSIAGANILAKYRDFTLTMTATDYDTTATEDEWEAHVMGQRRWEVSCSILIETTNAFRSLFNTGGYVVVSANPGGATFVGTGILTSATNTGGQGPQMEEITVIGVGTPTQLS